MRCLTALTFGFALTAGAPAVHAADWPTYRHDIARSGVTGETLTPPLKPAWVYRARHAPRHAWPQPVRGRRSRTAYDHAYHVAVADGSAYFGSSADDKIYCLDTATGRERWSVFTGGPVRLAPTVHDGRVYAGSDDGWVYCLDARRGTVRWKFHAAPKPRRLLGAGRMMSPWPVRTGVLVDRGIAYFAAGLFPAESIYLYAVRADTGRLVWTNDTCGQLYVYLPHGGAEGFSGMSPQGALLASAGRLYVPNARSVPAAFDRRDGRLLFWQSATKNRGGVYALLCGDVVVSGTRRFSAYDAETGQDRFACYPGHQLVVTPDRSYLLSHRTLAAVDRVAHTPLAKREEVLSRKRLPLFYRHHHLKNKLAQLRRKRGTATQPTKREQQLTADFKEAAGKLKPFDDELRRVRKALGACVKWQCPSRGARSLILAGTVLYAGGDGQVCAIDAVAGKSLWSAKVDGHALGLAVADRRLMVSTDTGAIHCFTKAASAPARTTQPRPVSTTSPYPADSLTPMYAAAAEAIVKRTGVTRGYGLVLGCGTGRLAYELAKRTELTIIGIEPDAARVASARRALDAAGLYGVRVSVVQGALERLPFAGYFANLIVSDQAIRTGKPVGSAKEVWRVLRPLGGVAYLGRPAEAHAIAKRPDLAAWRQWMADLPGAKLSTADGVWMQVTRGALPGVGQWTHQYADAGNSGCSGDRRVRCPLGVLWFGSPGPARMVNRHMRPAGPLSVGGRLFIQGDQVIMAVDAYNGLPLWERKIKGARRIKVGADASNLAATHDSVFVAVGNQCLRLDAATGQTRRTYTVAPGPDGGKRLWGWLACSGNLLLGSGRHEAEGPKPYRYEHNTKATKHFHSDCVFAINMDPPEAGKARWVYRGKLIPHSAIAVGHGRVFLVDGEQVLPPKPGPQDTRLVALDVASGQVCWQKAVALPKVECYAWDRMRGRSLIHADGKLVVGGCFGGGGLLVVSAKDGQTLWSSKERHVWRPLVVGDTVIAGPYAYDLRTGKQRTRTHPMTGQQAPWQMERAHGCGTLSACTSALFFRSGCVGIYDLVQDSGTSNWGGMRAGCWINAIPAAGLLLIPEASAWCSCSYPIQTTIALAPSVRQERWAVLSSSGPTVPVRHMAINLGAPGDRRAANGTLWLGYPRPPGRRGFKFKLGQTVLKGMGWFRTNANDVTIRGTDQPWIYASGCRGLLGLRVPLIAKGQPPAGYTINLGFADPDNDAPGVRVFDIKLQGKTVAKDFDVVRAAGARHAAVVKAFSGVRVANVLTIELVPKHATPSTRQAPVLSRIEIARQEPSHSTAAKTR